MRPSWSIPAVVVAGMLSAAPVHAQVPNEDPLAGRCFEIRLGDWDPPLHPAAAPTHSIPELVFLSRKPLRGSSDSRLMVPAPPRTHHRRPPYALWVPVGRGPISSARLSWSSEGFSGVAVTIVRASRGRIRGIAEAWADGIPLGPDGRPIPWSTAEFEGIERPCPADPEDIKRSVRARESD